MAILSSFHNNYPIQKKGYNIKTQCQHDIKNNKNYASKYSK